MKINGTGHIVLMEDLSVLMAIAVHAETDLFNIVLLRRSLDTENHFSKYLKHFFLEFTVFLKLNGFDFCFNHMKLYDKIVHKVTGPWMFVFRFDTSVDFFCRNLLTSFYYAFFPPC